MIVLSSRTHVRKHLQPVAVPAGYPFLVFYARSSRGRGTTFHARLWSFSKTYFVPLVLL
jgi:hypothetical protein